MSKDAFLSSLLEKLQPLMAHISTLTPSSDVIAPLSKKFPVDGDACREIQAMLREGREAGFIGDRENMGIKFSRVVKAASPDALSVDFVNMKTAGPGHTHPNGEFDLCFVVDGAPTFDGNPPGWTVYEAGTWHTPTVDSGEMDILYFLPGGAIQFVEKP